MASLRDRIAKHSKEASKNASADFTLPNGIEVVRFEELHQPKKTKHEIDFLLYPVTQPGHPDNVEVGEDWYRRPFSQHFIPGKKAPVICPRSVGKKCPLCEIYERESKRGGLSEQELQDIKAKDRVLFPVLLDGSDDITILNAGNFAFARPLAEEIQKILDEDPESPVAEFCNRVGGSVVTVRSVQKSFGSKGKGGGNFIAADRFDFDDRDDIPKSIMNEVPELDDIFTIHSYEELEAMYLRGSEGGEEGDDDKPSRGRSRGRGSDDDGEERTSSRRGRGRDSDEENEPVEEKPASRRRGRASEEEQEEKPAPRRRGRGSDDDEGEEKSRRGSKSDESEEKPAGRRGRGSREETAEEKPSRGRGRAADDDEGDAPKCPNGLKLGIDFMSEAACDECDIIKDCRNARPKK